MARPRKDYGSEQARIEALRQANRDRVKRHRDAKKAEAEKWLKIGLGNSDDLVLPSVEELERIAKNQPKPKIDPDIIWPPEWMPKGGDGGETGSGETSS